jgi:NADH:ubiquinone oxidoreductase subunit 5 (subunit L)/multisubunit Na+/H+ antiporter MnhA subunit
MMGILTNFFSSAIAIFQSDIKKIIAYSTMSQLGYMFIAVGLSFYNVAFFHLFNHAFFKALLFLCAGVLIHISNNEQDKINIGSNSINNLFTSTIFSIGQLILIGTSFYSAYYSKELIVQLTSIENTYLYYFLF